ncbi:MAG TPA: nitrous oxide reductase accessory protein NosL [Longimicrobiales bacterium]|nr:nitrous oxide reductase accessory protein NosL [Longimicrobiales bacterium]
MSALQVPPQPTHGARTPRSSRPRTRPRTVAAVALLALAACGVRPAHVHLGEDECAHCRMVITDRRFAAQLLTDRGRAYLFDSIECLIAFTRSGRVPDEQIHSLLVTDFSAADGWTDARTATYLRSPAVQSPMGSGLAAHATEHGARDHQRLVGGEILRWDDVFRNTGAHEPDGAGMRGDGERLFAEPDHGD